MITVAGGTPAMQSMQDGAYQEATLIVYDVSQSGTPELTRFGNDSVISGSLTVSKSCGSNGVLEIGSAVSDELKASIRTTSAIAGSMRGNIISLIVSWEYGATSPESIYVFSGIVTEVKRASNGVYNITALDAMIVFDAPYRLSELKTAGSTTPLTYPVSVIDLMRSIVWSKGAPYVDVNTILTSQSPINLNANATVSDIPEGQGYTYRQILQWCAQWMGVNLRIAAGATPAIEMWLWRVPPQIGDITDCSDEPYGITGGNSYEINIDETELLTPQFTIVSGENYLYGLGNVTSYPGVMPIKANPIILSLYNDYYLAFQVYAGNIQDQIDNAFLGVVGNHFSGNFRSTPRWYLQPGDFIVSVTSTGAAAHVVTSVTHRLNGACTITAGGFGIGTSDDSSATIPSFSPEQNNELTARFQDICFYPGETYNGNAFAHGYVTHGADRLQLTMPLKKIFSPQTQKVNISSLIISLRVPTGGWIKSDGFDATQYITSKSVFGNSLHLRLDLTNDTWYATNNVPVCGEVQITMQVH